MSTSARIGPAGATAIVAGTMLGVGILLTPPVVAAAAPSLPLFFGLWLLGGLVALSGAVAYAELGAAFPRAGGDLVFQGEAFGPSLAFASGLVGFAFAFAGSIAAMAAAVGQYQAQTLVTAAGLDLDLSGGGDKGVALVLILGLTAINIRGLRLAVAVQLACTLVPLVALAGLAVGGLLFGPPPLPLPPPSPGGPGALAAAFGAVYFSYAGWPAVVYIAGEVRDPGRTLPLAMLGGTVVVTALYLLLCAAFVSVLGMGGLAQAGEAGSALARALLGPTGEALMAGLVLIALLASINGTILGGARVAVGMAERGLLPARLGRLWGSNGTPAAALLLQAALACAVLLSGRFSELLALSGLSMMGVGSFSVFALYRLRRSRPDLPRPYRASGYPSSPLLYLLASGLTIGLSLWGTVVGDEGLLPIFGVIIFVVLALLRALWGRRAQGSG